MLLEQERHGTIFLQVDTGSKSGAAGRETKVWVNL